MNAVISNPMRIDEEMTMSDDIITKARTMIADYDDDPANISDHGDIVTMVEDLVYELEAARNVVKAARPLNSPTANALDRALIVYDLCSHIQPSTK